ncbi:MAG: hypothetical protein AB7E79_09545 [Rhodospirillaceae bacterium]
MTRILVFLLALLALPACSTLPERVVQAPAETFWMSYTDWARGFAVEAPGRFEIRPASYETPGVMTPYSYTLDRGTLRFSVVAVERRRRDDRDHYTLSRDNGFDLMEWDRIMGTSLPIYQRHVYLDGKMYRQRIVFTKRMVYELLVSGPADVFPDFVASRFLESFVVMVKT